MHGSLKYPVAAVSLLVLSGAGCSSSSLTRDITAADPASRSAAIAMSARTGDPDDPVLIDSLIEELDSDDPLVRMMAITALQRLTGQTHGYQFDGPPEQREAAVNEWVAAANRQRLAPTGHIEVSGQERRDG